LFQLLHLCRAAAADEAGDFWDAIGGRSAARGPLGRGDVRK